MPIEIGVGYRDLGFEYRSGSVLLSYDIIDWCTEHFGLWNNAGRWMWSTGGDYISDGGHIVLWFKNIDDCTLFQLTWQ